MSKQVRRLFEQFRPESYTLELTPNSKSMDFCGTVTITGKKMGRPSKRITFHQKDLKITKASITKITKAGSEPIEVSRINLHPTYDEVRLHTNDPLYPGTYSVELEFSGLITKQMDGLYPCFFEHDNQKKMLLATQFESHFARQVFPTIDEPEAKATFDLTLITPDHETVLSNTPIESQEKFDGSKLKTRFETTPVMSTYLLAFVIGELHSVTAKTKNGTDVSTWSTVAQPKESLTYANQEAVDILEFFEGYFATPFPLKKCDQVALPDFDAGAMENWGLVTYREIALLADPNNRSVSSEQYVSMVVGHELSHQWFGNLVTMKWWDDLWLNESFASLMEHLCLDVLHPDWHQWEQYASSDIISCSNRDIYKDVQPVKMGVNHPDEISTLFDGAIVYSKGGRLLKMMREYIGDEAFREGLRTYFKKHAYKNTIRDDLWTEMTAAGGKDVNKLMDAWLEQSGMPVVRIEPGGNKHERNVSQQRFVLDKKDDTQLWSIPLLANKKLSTDLLPGRTATIKFDGDLPIINAHGSGHYVTHYASDQDLAAVTLQIKSGSVNSEARINIFNDMLLLARRGDDSIVDALKLVKALDNEPRDAVWSLMCRTLGLSGNLGENETIIEVGLKKLRYTIAHKNYKTLGWDDADNDDPNTKMLRATTIGLMLGSEDKAIIEKALKLYRSVKNIEDIPADRRGLVLGAVVRHGKDAKEIDSLIETYKTSHNPDLQHDLAGALTFSRDPKFNKRIVYEALGEDGFVRPQDIFRWFAYLMRNKYSRDITWEWLVNSWDRLFIEVGDKSIDHFVVYSAATMQTREWHDKFQAFFNPKHDYIPLTRKIDIANSEIAARIAWRDRELPKLTAYFS